jgi:cell division control protein 6
MSDPVDRLLDAVESGKSIIKNREILHFSYIPETIQHRKTEQEQVTQALSPILKQSRPSNLLVYGEPGTGKTLVIKKVLNKIQERVEKSNFPIKLVYTNSKDETAIYGLLVSLGRQIDLKEDQLPGNGLAISDVFNRLLKKINDEKLNVIFVIDEIDYLAKLVQKTGKDILYQLTRANERLERGSLSLVGISNDLTFKDSLDPRVISSLGEEEIVFKNYNVEQIKKILEERINDAFLENSVETGAINRCAAEAGGEHGDARRAIDLILKAGEIAERQQSEKVTDKHVIEASQKMEEQLIKYTLEGLPLHKKLVILAIMRSKGSSTGEIYLSYKNLCKSIGKDELTNRRVKQLLSEIDVSGIITGKIVSQGSHGSTKKFTLDTATETIKKAFKNDLTLQDII